MNGFFLYCVLLCVPQPFGPSVIERAIAPQTGDLDVLRQSGRIRVLVSFSRTNFFISQGAPRGFEADLFAEYERFLKRKLPTRAGESMTFVFIPVAFDDLLPALLEGRGDVAAGGLTVTPERRSQVAFTDPYIREVDEIVVASKSVAQPQSLDELSGREVRVVRGSSYVDHLARLNESFAARGREPTTITQVDASLEAEDLLEMVNANICALTVVDRHIAEAWSQVLPNLVLCRNVKVNAGGQIALAVRRGNPQLLGNLNGFISSHAQGTTTGNILFRRYFEQTKWLRDPLTAEQRAKLGSLRKIFQKYGTEFNFDWEFLAAQAFQESAFDPTARSGAGAIGLMQLLPSTARELGFPSITSPDDNVHAGAKYMAKLRDTYFSDPALARAARLDFVLAAYNAGPGNVGKWRSEAKSRGLDPNLWRGNVERISLERVGEQTFRYVRNINKYYIAYKESLQLLSDRDVARAEH